MSKPEGIMTRMSELKRRILLENPEILQEARGPEQEPGAGNGPRKGLKEEPEGGLEAAAEGGWGKPGGVRREGPGRV